MSVALNMYVGAKASKAALKGADKGSELIAYIIMGLVGLVLGGYLWFYYKIAGNPSMMNLKDMKDYDINLNHTLKLKKIAFNLSWLFILSGIFSIYLSTMVMRTPTPLILVLLTALVSGLVFLSKAKEKTKVELSVAKEFNRFLESYNSMIEAKQKIINNAISSHGRDSEEYKSIAQQEFSNLMKTITEKYSLPLVSLPKNCTI